MRKLRSLYVLFRGYYVRSNSFVKHIGKQCQPIAITSQGKTNGYFVSQQEYDKYLKLKSQSKQIYRLDDLPATTIEALSQAQMSAEHHHLNALID